MVGQAAYSVRHEPIATVPADCEEPLGSGVVADVMHARMRVGDQLVKGSIGISADFRERVTATRGAQSPYNDLSVRELREVICLKTRERTGKQNPECLRVILHRIDFMRSKFLF